MYEDRIARAVGLFKQGFNCSQAVVGAFADLYGFSEGQGLRMAASFGGGIGKMRQTCGAACGMFMLAGLDCGSVSPRDAAGKAYNYAVVQQLAARFKAENGSLICGELLGLVPRGANVPDAAKPGAPAAPRPAKRPCVMMVETAARLFADYLEQKSVAPVGGTEAKGKCAITAGKHTVTGGNATVTAGRSADAAARGAEAATNATAAK